jgi:hypothetical protein
LASISSNYTIISLIVSCAMALDGRELRKT